MVDALDRRPAPAASQAEDEAVVIAPRSLVPSWLITTGSVVFVLVVWQLCGPFIDPLFGTYPTAIVAAFWKLVGSGKLAAALADSLRPFAAGFALAIVIGVPLGLVIGRFRVLEAAIGIYVTAGFAM